MPRVHQLDGAFVQHLDQNTRKSFIVGTRQLHLFGMEALLATYSLDWKQARVYEHSESEERDGAGQ